jgi:hypothetical protein
VPLVTCQAVEGIQIGQSTKSRSSSKELHRPSTAEATRQLRCGPFSAFAAVILCVCGLSAAHAAERFAQWSLEQPDDFVFALSFKRPILFDVRSAASQLAFVCNQEKKDVAVLLMPLDGTFTSRHEAIPVAVQKTENNLISRT